MSWWTKLIDIFAPEPLSSIGGFSPETRKKIEETKIAGEKMVKGYKDMLYKLDYYKPKHFITQEFVDKNTYSIRGEDSINNIDTRMLITMDRIREYFDKPITINNWKWGGDRSWSGLRTKDSKNFSQYSQHTFGRAIDFVMKGISAQEVRDEIKSHQDNKAFEFITRMEEFDGMQWIHIDCKNWNREDGIYVFKP